MTSYHGGMEGQEPEHHAVDDSDKRGKAIGVMAAVISLFLAIVTIASHRSHTHAILLKSEANDKWAYYQAQRIKFHNLELGEDLLQSMGSITSAGQERLHRYATDKVKYEKRSEETQEEAHALELGAQHVEVEALRFDIGEGLLEIGIVLTSLYFLSKSMMFPAIGGISAVVGIILGVLGYLT